MAAAGAIGDAFCLANRLEQELGVEPPYRFSVLSESGGFVNGGSCFSIWTQKLDRYQLTDFHAFFVACSGSAATESSEELVSWLSRQNSTASSCIRQKTDMSSAPGQSGVPVFVLDDGLSETRAAGATATDMALAQIERDLSAETAHRIAHALQPDVRERIRPDMDDLSMATTTEKIRESARWIRENYSKAISVSQAAECATMSKRNYQRRFKVEFGMTPLEYLLRTRFEVVCSMLMDTDLPIDKIARRCGMGDGNRLGRIFKVRYGMSPTSFRALRHLGNGSHGLTPVSRSGGAREYDVAIASSMRPTF
ncbi:helix-turn-helix domain-containing protein [Paraburkholderia sp. LEh10]|uniref:helix-turn-helix domain-containing protein n=1 Tax=Paraburkholderia sp. LEh10 TaxID=2821353 RepID=UPI001AE1F560|nr:helix-turn-helix domain-containing protein [Paraburkholderia sp. LEh10]MBP0589688.1 helix-turn-helix domain-containing protein [Paraburkholderia sp. LEh10]